MRVSTFLEEKDFRLKDMEYLSPAIKAPVVDHHINVPQFGLYEGHDPSVASIDVQFLVGIFQFDSFPFKGSYESSRQGENEI
ncbi:hypothetical protein ABIE27_003717 [Paenibacillus sp. 4624]|uniref:Uncharacterized protein n=1 Tax=Paenibacillus amylolyticus TaxID=1451 RepID=A0A5M9X0X7_PAEAM|nr:hypothetical protein [Paenibacillus amylolyticus]KAA8787567.1 hypothetical protein EC604_27420 [Paenibacillus amylolyticus]